MGMPPLGHQTRQKMGPHHPLSSHIAFLKFTSVLSPLAKAKPPLAPRTLLLASITGAKLESLSKGCVLEEWVFVGLKGGRIMSEKLEVVLDLGPDPLTRESPFLLIWTLCFRIAHYSQNSPSAHRGPLRTAEVPHPRAAAPGKALQLLAEPVQCRLPGHRDSV